MIPVHGSVRKLLRAGSAKPIMQNLESVFKDKTVVIVAHRLSTVKNADNIVVLENGHLVEEGTHFFLSNKKGHYFELIRNQLEMGDSN